MCVGGGGGKACFKSNAYYPRTPDYSLYSGVHVCLSEHFDSSFVQGFMRLDYGLGTMEATTSKGNDFNFVQALYNSVIFYETDFIVAPPMKFTTASFLLASPGQKKM